MDATGNESNALAVGFVNLSDIQVNGMILSAEYYTEKKKGKSPYTLESGKLKAWEGTTNKAKSLPADAIYLTPSEYEEANLHLSMIARHVAGLKKYPKLNFKISLTN